MPDVPVYEVNALTARWAAGRPDQGTVFSGARAVLDLLATSPGTRGALGL